jgi:hypothetical protein
VTEEPRTEEARVSPFEKIVVASLLLGPKHTANRGIDALFLCAQRLAATFEHLAPEVARRVAVLVQDGADALLLLRVEIEPARENA